MKHDIFDMGLSSEQLEKKQKIYEILVRNNNKSKAYDEIIKNYTTLYENYMNSKANNLQSELYRSSIKSDLILSTKSKEDLAIEMSKLLEENLKVKNDNQKNLENLKNTLESYITLKTKLENCEKQLSILIPENEKLQRQNLSYKNRNEELDKISKELDSENINLKTNNKKLEFDIRNLNETINKMLKENKSLTNKILNLQQEQVDKMNEYNELFDSAQKKKDAADRYFKEKKDEFMESEIMKKMPNMKVEVVEEVKIPKKIKFKFRAHNQSITSITFNSFGSNFITTGGDYFIKHWDASKNSVSGIFSGFTGAVNQACYDHTEQFLFAGSMDKTAKLWNLKNNRLTSTFTGHVDYINCVGTYFSNLKGLTGSSDRTIKEWDFSTSRMIKNYNCGSGCFCLGVAFDDSYVISGHLDGTIKLWSNGDRPEKVIDLHEDKILHLELLKNESQLLTISNDYMIKLFDIRKMDTAYTITDKTIPQFCQSSISVSSDKKFFAVGSNKGTIYICDIKNGTLKETIDNKNFSKGIIGITWRPFHSEIYVGDEAGYLTIWSTEQNK